MDSPDIPHGAGVFSRVVVTRQTISIVGSGGLYLSIFFIGRPKMGDDHTNYERKDIHLD